MALTRFYTINHIDVYLNLLYCTGALDYLLPEEYVNTMKVLHSRSPEMALSDIYSVVQQELGQEV